MNQSAKPYLLSDSHLESVNRINYDLAILPWGATEAHNKHLPYGTDNYEVDRITTESARRAWEMGARIIVLPNIPFGVQTGQKGIKLTMNLYPSTQLKIIHDILENLSNSGIPKLLIMNGHGGNDFRQILREAGSSFPEIFICSCNWYQALDKKQYFAHEGDHADEMETSLMLYLEPELVLPLDKAGDGAYKQFRVKAFNEGWAWSERKWIKISSDTGVGYPREATIKKGEEYFSALVSKLSRFFVELAGTENNDIYT